jgi:hypothetical protein
MKKTILTSTTPVSMKPKFLAAITLFVFALGMFGCKTEIKTGTNNSNTSKPANTNSTTTTKKAEAPKPKTEIKSEKKPEGTAKTASKKVPVPSDWVYMYDESKGYGFSLPEGSKGDSSNVEGIDVFVGATPAPSEIAIFVLAYKDKTLTKEDLLNDAVEFLKGMGETVQAGKLTAESENYSLAEATTTNAEGGKSKMKILVGTDVTDNYVMIVGSDESKFEANKEIIDAIWGSFEMWSGNN